MSKACSVLGPGALFEFAQLAVRANRIDQPARHAGSPSPTKRRVPSQTARTAKLTRPPGRRQGRSCPEQHQPHAQKRQVQPEPREKEQAHAPGEQAEQQHQCKSASQRILPPLRSIVPRSFRFARDGSSLLRMHRQPPLASWKKRLNAKRVPPLSRSSSR